MNTPDPVNEFLTSISPFETVYQWKLLSFIAIKNQETVHVLQARISFFFDFPSNETPFYFETDTLGSLKDAVKILPVIVLRKYRREAQSAIGGAEKYGISVITRDELEFLLGQANFTPNSDILFFRAQRFIPQNMLPNNIVSSFEAGI